MRYLSLFSGIEAASVAWRSLGWSPVAFSEINPFCCALLEQRYPDITNLGDITQLDRWPYERLQSDLVVGGTPCQDLSIAGRRRGLVAARSGLFWRYLEVVEHVRPRWLVWENVPGALSSNRGRDFGIIIGALGKCGYQCAWRVLDAQYCRTREFSRAVPQRRRRVFLVGYLGDWRPAAAVLFDAQSLQGNPAPRRESREIAPTLSSRSTAGGGLGADHDLDGGLIANCLTSRQAKGIDSSATATMVGHDASEDGTGRGTPLVAGFANQGGKTNLGYQEDVTASVTGSHGNPGCVAFAENSRAELRELGDAISSLSTPGGKPGQGYPAIVSRGVRRLTPRECERLMGFPDDWTLIKYRGKPAPDSPRYRALGNSMAVNCMQWIGERIRLVEEMINQEECKDKSIGETIEKS